MATAIYDVETIKDLRKALGDEAIELAAVALAVGWKVTQGATGSISLTAPGVPSPKTIHLSSRGRGKGNFQSMARSIIRWGSPAAVEQLRRDAESTMGNDRWQNIIERNAQTQLAVQEVMERLPEPAPVPVLGAFGQVVTETTTEEYQALEQPSKGLPPVMAKDTRHIVTERPAMMHMSLRKTGGKSYPSKTTVERKWSDGTTDYRCAVSTCDRTSDNKLSFRGAHWAMHVKKGEAEPFDVLEAREQQVDDPNYTEPAYAKEASTKQENRRKQLIDFIATLGDDLSDDEMADAILDHLFPAGRESGPAIPLTDAQVLQRIRNMVDRGAYAEQEQAITALQIEVDEKRAMIERANARHLDETKELTARVKRAEGNLTALRELLNEAHDG